MTVKKIAELSTKIGIAYFILYAILLIVSFVNFFNPSLVFSILDALIGLLANICFLFILFGLQAISKERADFALKSILNISVILVIFLICTNLPLAFRIELTTLQHTIATILGVLVAYTIGIVEILLSKNLIRLQDEFGKDARKAALWNKISGWLTITIILLPIGLLLGVVADFYEWRIVRQRSRK